MNEPRIGLCSSGGSISGIAAHTGFGLAMEDLHMWPSIKAMIGNSAGAMYVVPVAMGITPRQMYEMICELEPKYVVDIDLGGMAKSVVRGLKGWVGLTESINLLKFSRDAAQKYRGTRHPKFKDLNIPTWVIAANVSRATKDIIGGPSDKRDALLCARASAAIPGAMQAIKVEDEWYMDGGGLSNIPAVELAKKVPDLDLIIVSTRTGAFNSNHKPNNDFMDKKFTLFHMLKRYFTIIQDQQNKRNFHLAVHLTPIVILRIASQNIPIGDFKKVDILKAISQARSIVFKKLDSKLDETIDNSIPKDDWDSEARDQMCQFVYSTIRKAQGRYAGNWSAV